MPFVFSIVRGKIVLQYPCINPDHISSSKVLYGLFPSEKGSAAERPTSLFHVLFSKWGKYAKQCISQECYLFK